MPELILAIAKRLVDLVDGRIDTAADFDIHVLADFVELGLLMSEVSSLHRLKGQSQNGRDRTHFLAQLQFLIVEHPASYCRAAISRGAWCLRVLVSLASSAQEKGMPTSSTIPLIALIRLMIMYINFPSAKLALMQCNAST